MIERRRKTLEALYWGSRLVVNCRNTDDSSDVTLAFEDSQTISPLSWEETDDRDDTDDTDCYKQYRSLQYLTYQFVGG